MSNWFTRYGFAEVYPDLLIGAYPLDRDDVDTLARMMVQRVLNLVEDSEYRPGQRDVIEAALAERGIAETRLRLVDFGHLPAQQLDATVDAVVEWIERRQRGYIHCRAGWQRSAAVAAGAIALVEGIDTEHALSSIRQRKPSANPLPHQRADLASWWQGRVARPTR